MAVLGFLVGVAIFASVLSSVEWDASALLRVGEDNDQIISFVEEQLEHVRVVANLGHDGKYYFVHAHDPFLLDPETYAGIIDRPVYRTQRVLYPLLALRGWASPGLGSGLGSDRRKSPGDGAGNLGHGETGGVIGDKRMVGSGVRAQSWRDLRAHHRWSRDTGLGSGGAWSVAPGRRQVLGGGRRCSRGSTGSGSDDPGCSRPCHRFVERRPNQSGRYGPVALFGALFWALWVRWRLAVPVLTSESEEIGVPFSGLIGAATRWIEEPGRNLALGFVVIGLMLVAAMQVVRRPSVVVFDHRFRGLAPFLTRQVWLNYFDITRAVAPVFTTFVLVLFASQRSEMLGEPHDG